MHHRKPVDILAMNTKRQAIYLGERRACRWALFAGVPVVLGVLVTIKLSNALPIGWTETIVPPVGLAIFGLIGWGFAELSWRMWCSDTADKRASAPSAPQ
jgi:hypothetical protein